MSETIKIFDFTLSNTKHLGGEIEAESLEDAQNKMAAKICLLGISWKESLKRAKEAKVKISSKE
ncbi:hypothetical protein KAJ89_02885 [Candidatus Parcubacteria bacterium]|nr:hypothetical protein [Candidatus Parcubacteria bacterium]